MFLFMLKMFLIFPVELESDQRDIVFLLDGSDDTQSVFPAMKIFVQRVIETLSVGETKDRVSVVQYSNDPQTHFSLNTYFEKQDILSAAQELTHKGGSPRNTGAALEYVQNNVFTNTLGSRNQDGVPQILVVLNGGKSQDDVTRAAAALKKDRVIPICVGNRNSDILELQNIAHIPSYAVAVHQFDMGNTHHVLASLIKKVPRQPKQKPPSVIGKNETNVCL